MQVIGSAATQAILDAKTYHLDPKIQV